MLTALHLRSLCPPLFPLNVPISPPSASPLLPLKTLPLCHHLSFLGPWTRPVTSALAPASVPVENARVSNVTLPALPLPKSRATCCWHHPSCLAPSTSPHPCKRALNGLSFVSCRPFLSRLLAHHLCPAAPICGSTAQVLCHLLLAPLQLSRSIHVMAPMKNGPQWTSLCELLPSPVSLTCSPPLSHMHPHSSTAQVPCHPSLAPLQPSCSIHVAAPMQKGPQWTPLCESPPSPVSLTCSLPLSHMRPCAAPPKSCATHRWHHSSRLTPSTSQCPCKKALNGPPFASCHPLLSHSLTHRPCPTCVLAQHCPSPVPPVAGTTPAPSRPLAFSASGTISSASPAFIGLMPSWANAPSLALATSTQLTCCADPAITLCPPLPPLPFTDLDGYHRYQLVCT